MRQDEIGQDKTGYCILPLNLTCPIPQEKYNTHITILKKNANTFTQLFNKSCLEDVTFQSKTNSFSMRQSGLKVFKILINCVFVYIISHSNRCKPDAATSDWRTTVILSLFTYQNGLVMAISNITREKENVSG